MKNKIQLAMIIMMSLLAFAWAMGGCSDSTDPEPEPEPTTGTVTVSPDPAELAVTWNLSGPDGYSYDGSNGATLGGLTPGDYTITWDDVSGYFTPAAETLTLAAGHTVNFAATYVVGTGTITINPDPDYLNLSWILSGVNSFEADGQNESTFPGLPLGDYTITWTDNTNWITPAPETQALTLGATIEFAATYTQPPNSILVTKEPSDLSITWGVVGPNSYSSGGAGEGELMGLLTIYVTAGSFTFTWGDVAGWVTPDPETQVLNEGGTLQFHGVYVAE